VSSRSTRKVRSTTPLFLRGSSASFTVF
jgi:hypothetical protein